MKVHPTSRPAPRLAAVLFAFAALLAPANAAKPPHIVIVYADDLGRATCRATTPRRPIRHRASTAWPPRGSALPTPTALRRSARPRATACSPASRSIGRPGRRRRGLRRARRSELSETRHTHPRRHAPETGIPHRRFRQVARRADLARQGRQAARRRLRELAADRLRKKHPAGRWPNARGFDESFITPNCPTHGSALHLHRERDGARRPPDQRHKRETLPNPGGKWRWDNDEGWMAPGYEFVKADLLFYDKMRDVHHRGIAKKHPEKPFFAVLSTQIAHAPVLPAPEFNRRNRGRPARATSFMNSISWSDGCSTSSTNSGSTRRRLSSSTPTTAPKRSTSFGCGEDHDHDPAGGWRGMKRDGWEGGHRVPFIARWPGRIPTGQVTAR